MYDAVVAVDFMCSMRYFHFRILFCFVFFIFSSFFIFSIPEGSAYRFWYTIHMRTNKLQECIWLLHIAVVAVHHCSVVVLIVLLYSFALWARLQTKHTKICVSLCSTSKYSFKKKKCVEQQATTTKYVQRKEKTMNGNKFNKNTHTVNRFIFQLIALVYILVFKIVFC